MILPSSLHKCSGPVAVKLGAVGAQCQRLVVILNSSDVVLFTEIFTRLFIDELHGREQWFTDVLQAPVNSPGKM